MSKADFLKSINTEQQLFVFKSGGGVTCWGFQNAVDEVYCLQTRLGEPVVEFALGDPEILKEHGRLVALLSASPIKHATWFNRHTCMEVRIALDTAREQGTMIRLWRGDTKTGKSWMDDHDVYGTVGRSMGPMKIPLLIENGRGDGGSAILDNCIIRIDGWKGKQSWQIYKHPLWHVPEMSVEKNDDSETKGSHPDVVKCNGEVQARFASEAEARRYVDFHLGKVKKI